MCLGTMYTSIVGSFGSGTELVISTVRSSIGGGVEVGGRCA